MSESGISSAIVRRAASTGRSPSSASTKASALVVPPQSAERVASRMPPKTCVCTSIAPGSTRQPPHRSVRARTIDVPDRPDHAVLNQHVGRQTVPSAPPRRRPRSRSAAARSLLTAGRGFREHRRSGEQASRVLVARVSAPARLGRFADLTLIHHQHRSATQATTPRSWVMKSMLRLSSRWSSASSSSTAACTETSERRGDLVADEQLGLRGQRARDRDALAFTAGELDREAPAERSGQPDPLEQLATSVAASPRHRPRSARTGRSIERLHRAPRVERVERVLEHDLDAAPAAERPVTGERRQRLAVDQDAAAVGRCRPTMQRAIVVLPLPDSPTSAMQPPDSTAKRDVLRRVRPLPAVRCAASRRSTSQQRGVFRAVRRRAARSISRDAPPRELPSGSSAPRGRATESSEHRTLRRQGDRRVAAGREGAAGGPFAHADRDAGDSAQRARPTGRGSPRPGRACRDAAAADTSSRGGPLDDAAGVHDGDRGRPSTPRPRGRGRRRRSRSRSRRAGARARRGCAPA